MKGKEPLGEIVEGKTAVSEAQVSSEDSLEMDSAFKLLSDGMEQRSRNQRSKVSYEGQTDEGLPDLFDSANRDVILKTSMVFERSSARKVKRCKGFTKIDHRYLPRVRKRHRDTLMQIRNPLVCQRVSGDEMFALYQDYELHELEYLERDQIETLTKAEVPDSDLTISLKDHIEKRIAALTKGKLSEDIRQELLTNAFDGTALLALTKYAEELVREKIDKSTIDAHMEKLSTTQTPPTDEYVRYPFRITQETLGNEFKHGPFKTSIQTNGHRHFTKEFRARQLQEEESD